MFPRMTIDFPSEDVITEAYFELRGWYAEEAPTEALRLAVNGRDLPLTFYARPDVEQAFPGAYARGFSTFIHLGEYAETSADVRFRIGDRLLLERRLRFAPGAVEQAAQLRRARSAKKNWLLPRLVCPLCKLGLINEGDRARCNQCSASFSVGDYPLRFMPPGVPEMEIEFQGQICSHGYDGDVEAIIAEVRRNGGKVLDCGAGLRPGAQLSECVITTEIFPYPSTDVLTVNQSLPFADGVFDAVLSLHVLEHVSDPFLCARELVRVLRPGGIVYAVTPMIVPEHGYPHHYFNPTIEGLTTLFSKLAQVESVQIPFMGHPINGVRSVLSLYAHNLSPATRNKFLDARVKDLLAGRLEDQIVSEIGTDLSEEGRRRLATNFAITARKGRAA